MIVIPLSSVEDVMAFDQANDLDDQRDVILKQTEAIKSQTEKILNNPHFNYEW